MTRSPLQWYDTPWTWLRKLFRKSTLARYPCSQWISRSTHYPNWYSGPHAHNPRRRSLRSHFWRTAYWDDCTQSSRRLARRRWMGRSSCSGQSGICGDSRFFSEGIPCDTNQKCSSSDSEQLAHLTKTVLFKRMYKNVHNGVAETHEISLHIVPFQRWKSLNLLIQHFLLCHLVCQIVIDYNLWVYHLCTNKCVSLQNNAKLSFSEKIGNHF